MRRSVTVERFVSAPRELVFDTFTMYETYSLLPIVLNSVLVHPGMDNPSNGVGAIRSIKTYFGQLKEVVKAKSRPDHWDYEFIEWPLPIPHTGGRMSFFDVPGGTKVVWQTSYEIPDTMPWKIISNGIDIGSIGALKFLIYLIGNEAEKKL